MLGSRTQGGRMEGADESTELWWHPNIFFLEEFPLLPIGNDILVNMFISFLYSHFVWLQIHFA